MDFQGHVNQVDEVKGSSLGFSCVLEKKAEKVMGTQLSLLR
jgi:hypothetical protein